MGEMVKAKCQNCTYESSAYPTGTGMITSSWGFKQDEAWIHEYIMPTHRDVYRYLSQSINPKETEVPLTWGLEMYHCNNCCNIQSLYHYRLVTYGNYFATDFREGKPVYNFQGKYYSYEPQYHCSNCSFPLQLVDKEANELIACPQCLYKAITFENSGIWD